MNNDLYVVKVTSQILIAGVLIFLAYVGGRITRRYGLGEIAGQILGGVIGGPVLMSLTTRIADNHPHIEEMMRWTFPLRGTHELALDTFTFFLPLYMGVILFSITDETHIDRVKENWKQSSLNFLLQSVLAFGLISSSLYFLLDLSWALSCIGGCLAIGTSPCSTFISISRRQVEGKIKSIWSQTVILESLAELFIVYLMMSFFTDGNDAWGFQFIGRSLVIIALISVFGFWCIRWAASNSFSADEIKGVVNDSRLKSILSSDTIPTVNIVFIIWSVVAILVGIAMGLKVPFMLPVIIAGVITANVHNQYVFDSLRIQDLMSFFHLIFFMLIGVHLDFNFIQEPQALKIAGIFFIMRLIGKMGGCYLSCRMTDNKKEMKKYGR